MPTVVGELTRGAVFNYLIQLGALGAPAPTAVNLSSDRLALTTNVAVYIVSAQSSTTDDIDGISGFNECQFLLLRAATGHTLTLKDENAGAAADTDKIRLPGARDISFTDDEAVFLYHDDTLDRWVLIAGPAAGGGVTDHGALTGLADDDHSQYATNTEFDDHNARHEPGGADAMAVDAAAGTGSLRTIGTAATAACAGNDARLSDARTPAAHKTSHQDAGSDEISVAGLSGLLADDQHVLDSEVTAVAVAKSLYDAYSILMATTDDTPIALTVAEQRLIGRITGGAIAALTPAQIMALLSGGATAAFAMNAQKITGLASGTASGEAVEWGQTSQEAAVGAKVVRGLVAQANIDPAWVQDASTTAGGKVELATAAEINTGTDTTRAMPVDQFVASNRNIKYLFIRSLGNTENHTVLATVGGDFESPIAGTIIEIGAYVDTAGVTGLATIDVHKNGTTLMTTNKITIDSAEKTSRTAATAPALTTTTLAAGDIITVDIDGIQTTAAKGLTVRLGVRLT